MTKAQALKLLKQKWTSHLFGEYDVAARYNPRGGTNETRDAARAELREHTAKKPDRTDREAMRAWESEKSVILGRVHSYRCEIGHLSETPFGRCFGIDGSGDSWEDAARAAKLI